MKSHSVSGSVAPWLSWCRGVGPRVAGLVTLALVLAGWSHRLQAQCSWTQAYLEAHLGLTMAYDAGRGKVVMFGGATCGGLVNDTWEWDGSRWAKRSPATRPSERRDAVMVYDEARAKMLLFGGDNGTIADTWTYDGTNWALMTPLTSPSRRTGHGMTYDRSRHRVVLFGGTVDSAAQQDTWEWDGTNWTQRSPSSSPSARSGHKLAYDPVSARVLMFHGSADPFPETWTWDGTDWQQLMPAMSPFPRTGFEMVTDWTGSRVILFGGMLDSYLCEDTFEWNGTTWIQRTPATNPRGRSGHAMAHDTGRGRTVMFGGEGTKQTSTWEYDGNDWRLQQDLPYWSGYRASMVWDPLRGEVVCFEGYYLETWVYRQGGWLKRTPATAPTWGTGSKLFFDSNRGRVVLHTGVYTWEWDGSNWTRFESALPPAVSYATAYDEVRKTGVLFTSASRTWLRTGTEWIEAFPASKPVGSSYGMVTAWHPVRKRVMGFGFGDGRETWEWDGSNWSRLIPANSPESREGACLVWDPVRARMVLFGATKLEGNLCWEWDGTNWSVRNFAAYPPPAEWISMAHDASLGTMVILRGGTWELVSNHIPNGSAGPDLNLDLQVGTSRTVTLTGTASDHEAGTLAYTWSRAGGTGPAVTLNSTSTLRPSFAVTAAGTYRFQFTAQDSCGDRSPPTTATIAVRLNHAPTVSASAGASTVVPGTRVTLRATTADSDGDPLAYSWSRTQGPATALSNANAAEAAATLAAAGAYRFQVAVTDGHGGAASASVNVTANTTPAASAGADQAVLLNSTVTLSGSGSDAEGQALSYAWVRTAGPAAVTLSGANTTNPSFFATTAGTYDFQLTVTDTLGATAQSSVRVRVNRAPTASAGPDRIVIVGSTVTLGGTASDLDGDPLAYSWRVLSGPDPGTLTDPTLPGATFVPTLPGLYSLELTVSDGLGGVTVATTRITGNRRPVAACGEAQSFLLVEGSIREVSLSGSGSDPDGDAIAAYSWTRLGGTGPGVALNGAGTASPTFRLSAGGSYVFSLTVTDARSGQSSNLATCAVLATVNRRPLASAGPDQPLLLQAGGSTVVTLSGSASDPDGDTIVSYSWRQASGPAVSLSSSSVTSPSIGLSVSGVYVFWLTVDDSRGATSTIDAVQIAVNMNLPPQCSAGADRVVLTSNALTLAGSAHDAEFDPISIGWQVTSGPDTGLLTGSSTLTPSFTPTAAGIYTLRLNVTDNHGGTGTSELRLTAHRRPLALGGPPQVVVLNEGSRVLVTLAGSGSDPDGDALVEYAWVRAGGSGPAVRLDRADLPAPSFVAESAGTYRFDLTVTDVHGARCAQPATATVDVVLNRRPTAHAGADQTAILQAGRELAVQLAGEATDPESGVIAAYNWLQTSGPAVSLNSSAIATPSFTTTAPGAREFALVVGDAHGARSTADTVRVVTVLNHPPSCSAGAGRTVNLGTGPVQLLGAAVDPDGEAVSYLWTRSGGTGPGVELTGQHSTSPSFVPTAAGIYRHDLSVRDTRGGSSACAVTISVNTVPVVTVTGDLLVDVGSTATLNGAAFDNDGDSLVYSWTRNGGSAPLAPLGGGDRPTATFVPPGAGTYTFTLTVSDGRGGQASRSFTVEANGSPVTYAGSDRVVNTWTAVALEGSASDPNLDPLTYRWHRTGGSGPAVVLLGDTTRCATFTPRDAGTYLFTLTASDGRGGQGSSQLAITAREALQNRSPEVSAGPSRTVRTGAPVTLSALASDADGDSLSYLWRCDRSPDTVSLTGASGATASFTPALAGQYLFTVTVSDGLGGASASSVTITVASASGNTPPAVSAGRSRTVCVGTPVTFAATATDADGDPIGFRWVRDGGTGPAVSLEGARSATAAFTPAALGTYLFTVIASDGLGASSSTLTLAVVRPPGPVARARISTPAGLVAELSGEAGTVVTLDGSYSKDLASPARPLTYCWSLLPGAPALLAAPACALTTLELPDLRDGLAHTVGVALVVTGADSGSEPCVVTLHVQPPPAEPLELDLKQGLNLVALPCDLSMPSRVPLLSDLLSATGAAMLWRSTPGNLGQGCFQGSSAGQTAAPPAQLEPCSGYLLLSQSAASRLRLPGRAWSRSPRTRRLTLHRGLNLVGLPGPVPAGYSAADLCALTGANFAARLRPAAGGSFEVYVPGAEAPPFLVEKGQGYLLSVDSGRAVSLP